MKLITILILSLLSFNAYAALIEGITTTERENNTPIGLSEIKGHNVYCGIVIGSYLSKTHFSGATLPTTVWDISLPNGTHYCVVTTVDIDDRESAYSNMATINVDGKYRPKAPFIPVNIVINEKITLTVGQ